MPDLVVSNLTKYYGATRVFENLSFSVDRGERVALIGQNGAGKTTLLKVLTGALPADQGTVSFADGARVAMTDQIPSFPEGMTARDVLKTAFSRFEKMAAELRDLERQMEDRPDDEALIRRHGALHGAFEDAGGYETDVALSKMIQGLSLDEGLLARPFELLSGGEKTRINLARVLLLSPDILLLDEPTNHLDLSSAAWLEGLIQRFRGTVFMVSHDRAFLDQTVDRILELSEDGIEEYEGGYSDYAVLSKKRREERQRLYDRQQEELRRLRDSAAKMHAHGTEKLHKRAFSIEKRMARMTALTRPRPAPSANRPLFEAEELVTSELYLIRKLRLVMGDRTLLDDLTLTVEKGDRLGIVGENGAGKTTLLRAILGRIVPAGGSVTVAPTVRAAYLPQAVSFENESRNLIDTLIYEAGLSTQDARDQLGAYGFSGEDQLKTVSTLSGGEKSRLYLAKLMAGRINTLILDEPTNHLDLPSREWIEEALMHFDGTLLFVSHDRYFLTRFATRVLELSGGGAEYFKGDWPAYLAYKERMSVPPPVSKAPEKPEKTPAPRPQKGREDKVLLKQIARLEREIEGAEETLSALRTEMEQKATDAAELLRLDGEASALEGRLQSLYNEWAALAEG